MTLADLFTAMANAIRAKGGTSAQIYPNQMPQAIADIQPQISLQSKTKSYTPSETAQSETVSADTGYDGLDDVTVNVGAISSGSATPAASISATGAGKVVGNGTIKLSKSAVSNTPQVTPGYISAGTAGNTSVELTATVTTKSSETFHPSASDQTIAGDTYLTGTQTFKGVLLTNLDAANIKKDVVVKVGDSTDDDCVTSVTGTYEGGSGASKNTQVVQGTTRTNSSSLTAIGSELTVSKTGTYDIYWSALRTNTSSSYTWGSRLYIDGTAYGTENTTWTNNVQNNHLTNISLTANQKLRVYGRETRGTSYYVYAPMLVIVEN